MNYTLRNYQTRCIEDIERTLETHQSTLAVLATGMGKTVIFCHLAKRWPGKVLILVNREELVIQTVEKLKAITGSYVDIEKAASWACKTQNYVVASIQSLFNDDRRARFAEGHFSLVVTDEAHHAPAKKWKEVIGDLTSHHDTRLLGVTATPKRADELAMGQLFGSVAFEMNIDDAIKEGWLVDVKQEVVHVKNLDFSEVRSIAGDLSESQLEAILKEEKIIHQMAAPTVEIAGDQPCLVFCVTVEHARLMEEVINRYKPKSARHLSGKSQPEERRKVVDDYREGKLQFLCNCGLFLEGFDAPETSVISMCRPTKSLPLYTQVVGRGTRPLPEIVTELNGLNAAEDRCELIRQSRKPSMVILDFAGNAGRHKLIRATDLLGGKYTNAVRDRARNMMDDDSVRPSSIETAAQALELSYWEEKLLEEEREREEKELREKLRREQIKARAEYYRRNVEIFGHSNSHVRQDQQTFSNLATDKQVRFLVYLGVSPDTARGYTKRQASAVIEKLKREKGMD